MPIKVVLKINDQELKLFEAESPDDSTVERLRVIYGIEMANQIAIALTHEIQKSISGRFHDIEKIIIQEEEKKP